MRIVAAIAEAEFHAESTDGVRVVAIRCEAELSRAVAVADFDNQVSPADDERDNVMNVTPQIGEDDVLDVRLLLELRRERCCGDEEEVVVVEAAEEWKHLSIHAPVRRNRDLDAAPQREHVDHRLAVLHLRVAQVDFHAAHDRIGTDEPHEPNQAEQQPCDDVRRRSYSAGTQPFDKSHEARHRSDEQCSNS